MEVVRSGFGYRDCVRPHASTSTPVYVALDAVVEKLSSNDSGGPPISSPSRLTPAFRCI